MLLLLTLHLVTQQLHAAMHLQLLLLLLLLVTTVVLILLQMRIIHSVAQLSTMVTTANV
jgi:hypothetical protein